MTLSIKRRSVAVWFKIINRVVLNQGNDFASKERYHGLLKVLG